MEDIQSLATEINDALRKRAHAGQLVDSPIGQLIQDLARISGAPPESVKDALLYILQNYEGGNNGGSPGPGC